MTVTLFNNISDNNVFSKQLETIATYSNAVARDSMDVINPVITIAANSIENANYVYIAENNRYYFVKNIDNSINFINQKIYIKHLGMLKFVLS